jgi:hypothetical protein
LSVTNAASKKIEAGMVNEQLLLQHLFGNGCSVFVKPSASSLEFQEIGLNSLSRNFKP